MKKEEQKKIKKISKVTMDDLAASINNLAKSVDTKIDKLDTKIDVLAKSVDIKIDDLAIAVKNGFDRTVSKDEFNGFKTEMYDFKRKSEGHFLDLICRMDSVEKRLDAIEQVLGPLLQVSSILQSEIREINTRVDHLERKVGIKTT